MSIKARYVEMQRYLLLVTEGEWTIQAAIQTLDEAKARAEAYGTKRLLIDLRSLKMPSSDFVRYETAVHIAKVFRPPYRIATVSRPESISRFAENVAVNRGAFLQAFVDEEQAICWLTGEEQPAHLTEMSRDSLCHSIK